MRAVAILVLLTVAACSGTEAQPAATPDDVVAAWLAALGGPADPGEFVIDGQLPVLASLGRPAEAPKIIGNGLSPDAEATFWATFVDGVEDIAGVAPGDLDVVKTVVLPIDEVDHAYVRLQGPDGATTVVVRGVDNGLIDMIATTGPALVRPLASLVEAVPEGLVDGPLVAASLRAGLSDPDLDLPGEFYGEVQDLIALIDR
jgi:hypothetical protein